MKYSIQQKLDRYMAIARNQASKPNTAFSKLTPSKPIRADGLLQVIRSKKDADAFMDELNSIINRAKK